MSNSNNLALARKWRPRNFESVVGQDPCCTALIHTLDAYHSKEGGRLHHAYLFTGTRGVGKTTLARILAKCLNCESGVSSKPCGVCSICEAIDQGNFVDLLEIDAASRTKVEDMRGLLDNVQYAPTIGRFKIYLIDEVHMLSHASFNALLKTLEEPPPHVKFLLATTDPQKLPATVLSRCVQFHLKPIQMHHLVAELEKLLSFEKIEYDIEALRALARAAEGSARDAVTLLDQAIAYGNGYVRFKDVQTLLGLSEVEGLLAILEAVHQEDATCVLQAIHHLERISKTDLDFASVLVELLTLIHYMVIAKQAPEALEKDRPGYNEIVALAHRIAPETLQLYYQIALMGRKDLPYAPCPKMGFEMVLLRMLAFRPLDVAEKQTVMPVPVVSVVSVESKPEWGSVVPHLKLSGLTKALAEHCVISEWSNQLIVLTLDESQKPLLNKRNETQLQEALSQYLGHSIGFKMVVGKIDQETPALQQQRVVQEEQKAVQTAIEQDIHVQEMLTRFNAKIEQVSVLPE